MGNTSLVIPSTSTERNHNKAYEGVKKLEELISQLLQE